MQELNKDFIEYCKSIKKNTDYQKLLLIQMPQVDVDVLNYDIAKANGYYIFPPTGLQYIYEEIKHRNIEVQIIDLNFEILKQFITNKNFNPLDWLNILKECIAKFNPTMIGVSCLFDFSIKYFIDVLEYLKKDSEALIITGGVIATFEWNNILKKDLAHFVIKGEAEGKINYLLDYITNENFNEKTTSNIYYKLNGNVKETNGELLAANFDKNLIDSYKLFNITEYTKYGSLNPFSRTVDGVLNFAVMQRSRGCRAQCTFCSVKKIMGSGGRIRSNETVLEEMEYLIEKQNINHFEWLDDDLLYSIQDFKELLEIIIEKKWNITWSANNGLIASVIDEETLKLINDSGCIGFKVGVETGNKEMLKNVKKPASLNSFLKLSAMLVNYPKIFVGGNIIVGLPNEKFYMLMDTFYFSIKMNFDWAVFTTCQAIRGASAFSEMGEYFENQMENKGGNSHNFIPTRSNKQGHIQTQDNIKKGLSVFLIDRQEIPNNEQVQELWFTFNLIVNFIFNKNLYPNGHPEKFIGWVEKARKAYPYNPYMLIFLAIAYKMQNNDELSKQRYDTAVEKINSDLYWKNRMEEFGITTLIKNFYSCSSLFDELDNLRNFINKKLTTMNVYIKRD